MHQLGYVNHFDVWVPHKLSKNKQTKNLDCILSCDSLLQRNENVPFLKQIMTGDKKWILYSNVEQEIMQQMNIKGQFSSKEGDVVYMVGLEGSPI